MNRAVITRIINWRTAVAYLAIFLLLIMTAPKGVSITELLGGFSVIGGMRRLNILGIILKPCGQYHYFIIRTRRCIHCFHGFLRPLMSVSLKILPNPGRIPWYFARFWREQALHDRKLYKAGFPDLLERF